MSRTPLHLLKDQPPMVRRPSVAGYFYPAEPALLRDAVDSLVGYGKQPSAACAVIVPHGSFRHCGSVLAAALSRTQIPRRCIVVGPSHTGSWMPWSIMARGWYRTPLGDVPIDEALSAALRSRCSFLEVDAWAQRGEHAIEVVLPFLQCLGPKDLSIVPVITNCDDEAQLSQAAEALAQVVRMVEEPVLLIASADLSQYEPEEVVVRQDKTILDHINVLDGFGALRMVNESGIRMCGTGAISTILGAAHHLKADRTEQVAYTTSAEAGGDPYSAIGYAGIRIFRSGE